MLEKLGAPPFVAGPLTAILLGLLCAALGRRLLLALRVPARGFQEYELGFLRLTLGTGLLQLVPYLLGAAKALSERNLLLSLGVLASLLQADIRCVLQEVLPQLTALRARIKRVRTKSLLWLALFAALMGLLLVRALSLGPFGDDDGYHLSAPKRWLASGELGYLTTYTTTNASMGFEMLYAIGLSLAGPMTVKVVHYSAGLATFVGMWLVARRLGCGIAGRLAVSVLLVATPLCNLPFLFGVAYVDFGATWMAVAALLLWLIWREMDETRLLVCLALCIGFAGSFKTTALSLGVAWAPVLIGEARRRRVPWARLALGAVALGVVALLAVLPWSYRSWRVTGNPVFPLLSGVIPTRDFGAALAGVFGRFMHYYSWGVAAGARLDEASRKRIVLATLVGIFACSALAYKLLKPQVLRSMLVLSSAFTMISVAVAGMVFRYWLPGIIGLVLVACVTLATTRFGKELSGSASTAALALALALQLLRPPPRGVPLASMFRIVTGVSPASREYANDPFWQMWQFINAHTQADARVLMVAFYTSVGASSYGGFWVDRTCFTTDSHMQESIRLEDWPGFLASLERAHITHVVVASHQANEGRHGFSYPTLANEYELGRRVALERGEKLAGFGLLELYRLRGSPPAATSR
jgi:hypothetical protein